MNLVMTKYGCICYTFSTSVPKQISDLEDRTVTVDTDDGVRSRCTDKLSVDRSGEDEVRDKSSSNRSSGGNTGSVTLLTGVPKWSRTQDERETRCDLTFWRS